MPPETPLDLKGLLRALENGALVHMQKSGLLDASTTGVCLYIFMDLSGFRSIGARLAEHDDVRA